MKPHEETWMVVGQKIDGETFGPWNIINTRGHFIGSIGSGCSPDAGAKLASAAPDMARVLLRISKLACPFCSADPGECSRTCALDAALNKAGVR